MHNRTPPSDESNPSPRRAVVVFAVLAGLLLAAAALAAVAGPRLLDRLARGERAAEPQREARNLIELQRLLTDRPGEESAR